MIERKKHTISELKSFRKSALSADMTEKDIDNLIYFLASNPTAGDEIQGTGGCRKVRFASEGNNKGKSGGVRVITIFSGDVMPVFLLTVFAKNQKVTLSKAERNDLKAMSSGIVNEYVRRVMLLARGEKG